MSITRDAKVRDPQYVFSSTHRFIKSLTALIKKYPSILNEIDGLKDILQADPQSETPLGRDRHKIRIAVA